MTDDPEPSSDPASTTAPAPTTHEILTMDDLARLMRRPNPARAVYDHQVAARGGDEMAAWVAICRRTAAGPPPPPPPPADPRKSVATHRAAARSLPWPIGVHHNP